jgi:hypothetical protein
VRLSWEGDGGGGGGQREGGKVGGATSAGAVLQSALIGITVANSQRQ